MVIFDSENREMGRINNNRLIKIKRLSTIKHLHEAYISVPCSRAGQEGELAAALKKEYCFILLFASVPAHHAGELFAL